MDDFDDEIAVAADEAIAATEYPLATEHLVKGSRVSAEEIERAFGVKPGTDEYRFKMLRARDFIAQRLAERGELVTIVSESYEIVILTDEEASAYNARRFENTRRAGERAFVRLGQVDRAKLSEEARKRHDRDIVAIGRRIQADHSAERPALRPAKAR